MALVVSVRPLLLLFAPELCESGWTFVLDYCMKLFNTSTTHSNASKMCHSQDLPGSEKAHLLTVCILILACSFAKKGIVKCTCYRLHAQCWTCTYTHIHTYIHTWMHACTHAHTHARTHTCIHTYVHVSVCCVYVCLNV